MIIINAIVRTEEPTGFDFCVTTPLLFHESYHFIYDFLVASTYPGGALR